MNTQINLTAPIPGLDTRGLAGVTHLPEGGWRTVRHDEDPMPATVCRPAESIATGYTVQLDGAMRPLRNGLRLTADVFGRGELGDPGFWHRLTGEAEPISHRLGTPRPCPVHGERRLIVPARGTRGWTPVGDDGPYTWVTRGKRVGALWACDGSALAPGVATTSGGSGFCGDDGAPLRCRGKVDSATGRPVTLGPGFHFRLAEVAEDFDPFWYRGESAA